MGQDKRWSTPPENGIRAQEPDELTEKLSRLKKKFAESGRRLTDGTVKGKSVGFVGGVRKPDSKA